MSNYNYIYELLCKEHHTNQQYLGNFVSPSGLLLVSDPCYNKKSAVNTWEKTPNKELDYSFVFNFNESRLFDVYYYKLSDIDNILISIFMVPNKTENYNIKNSHITNKTIGEISVDTGSIVVWDYELFGNSGVVSPEMAKYLEVTNPNYGDTMWLKYLNYQNCIKRVVHSCEYQEFDFHVCDFGFSSETLSGDGSYMLYSHFLNNEIVGISYYLDYIYDQDEED